MTPHQVQLRETVEKLQNKKPYSIRPMLAEIPVPTSNWGTVFVGVEAYETADVIFLRDFLQDHDSGWFENAAVIDGLAEDQLKAEVQANAAGVG